LPEEAGIGAQAHRCAQAASERSRPGWSPGRDQEHGGGVRADAVEPEQAGGAGSDQRHGQLAQALELAIEELGAAAEFAQG
jgi:hypothetical protein